MLAGGRRRAARPSPRAMRHAREQRLLRFLFACCRLSAVMAQTPRSIPAQAGIQRFWVKTGCPLSRARTGDGVAPVTSGDKISLDAPHIREMGKNHRLLAESS